MPEAGLASCLKGLRTNLPADISISYGLTVAEIAPSLLLVDIVRKCGRRDCFGEAEVEAGPGRARLLSRPGLDDGSSARSRNTDHPRRGGCEENISRRDALLGLLID